MLMVMMVMTMLVMMMMMDSCVALGVQITANIAASVKSLNVCVPVSELTSTYTIHLVLYDLPLHRRLNSKASTLAIRCYLTTS